MKKKKTNYKVKKVRIDCDWAGLTSHAQKTVFINQFRERPNTFEYLDTLVHEALHSVFPNHREKVIAIKSKLISGYIWNEGYRRKK